MSTHIRTPRAGDGELWSDRRYTSGIRAEGYELCHVNKQCYQSTPNGMRVKMKIVKVVSHVENENDSL